MIKKIVITNFYSFGEVVIPLHPETNILVGINGSGKSNFLKAIRLLKEGVDGVGLKRHVLDNLGGFDNIFLKAVPMAIQQTKYRLNTHLMVTQLQKENTASNLLKMLFTKSR